MKRPAILLLLALSLFLAAIPVVSAGPGENRNFRAHLSGDEEVPTAVDTRATGQATFQLSKDGESLTYRLNVANIEDVMMAHIHNAAAGQNGGVVVWLYPSEGPDPLLIPGRTQGTLAQGTITTGDLVGSLAGADLEDLVAEMRAGNTYVNVHTQGHGPGEIRGQIH